MQGINNNIRNENGQLDDFIEPNGTSPVINNNNQNEDQSTITIGQNQVNQIQMNNELFQQFIQLQKQNNLNQPQNINNQQYSNHQACSARISYQFENGIDRPHSQQIQVNQIQQPQVNEVMSQFGDQFSLTQDTNLVKHKNQQKTNSNTNKDRNKNRRSTSRKPRNTRADNRLDSRKSILDMYKNKKKLTQEQKNQRKQSRISKVLGNVSRLSEHMGSLNLNEQDSQNNQSIRKSKSTTNAQARISKNIRDETPVRQVPSRACNKNKTITSLNINEVSRKNIIQEQIKKPQQKAQKERIPRETVIANEYKDIDPFAQVRINQPQDIDEVCCDICQDDEAQEDDNLIVMCDICNVAVHQKCYGGDLITKGIPEGSWICDRCNYCQQNEIKCIEIKCDLCPELKGAMKYISKYKIWVHVCCINWIPEVYFIDENINQIGGKFNKDRCNISCVNCRIKEGQCIQCDYKTCAISCHVRCAMRRGMIPNCDKIEDLTQNCPDNWDIPIFCEKHRAKGEELFKSGNYEMIKTKKPLNKKKGNNLVAGLKRLNNQRNYKSKSKSRQKTRQQKQMRNKSQRSSVSITRTDRKINRQKRVAKVIAKRSKSIKYSRNIKTRSKTTNKSSLKQSISQQIQRGGTNSITKVEMQQLNQQMQMLLKQFQPMMQKQLTQHIQQKQQTRSNQKRSYQSKRKNNIKQEDHPMQIEQNTSRSQQMNLPIPSSIPFHQLMAQFQQPFTSKM